ncbi:MAG: hypothetical protein APF84_03190 [Gracilibacter sp. BRH_c7a]|nr:MAG: hypothetical protein APF84_03190 [Gracilibacter sp. BRH_c7a]
MAQVKSIYKLFITIFSEIIWVYYGIVMFTSVKWNQPAFFDLTWIMVAGVIGYTLNNLLVQKSNQLLFFLGNILVIGFIVLQNWISVVPEGGWGFGLAVSIGLSFIFIRSARLVYRQPNRRAILQHFEGNVMLYIVFAFVFTLNQWTNQTFHLLFIVAIVSTLLGMILTLQNHEDSEDNQMIRIMKVGQSKWFAGMVIVLFICIPIFSLALLLPSVNHVIYSLGMGIWEGFKWLALRIDSFLGWLSSFIDQPEMIEIPGTPEEPTMPPGAEQGTFNYSPSKWITAGALTLLVLIAFWILSKLIRNRQISKPIYPKNLIITKESWWENFRRDLKAYLQYLKLRWHRRFPYFYYKSVYWHYHQVIKWGKKNGLVKLKSETSQEYVKRLINHIPETETCVWYKDQKYELPELLMRLSRDYQAVYYGQKAEMSEEKEYKFLINQLQNISLSDKVLQAKN